MTGGDPTVATADTASAKKRNWVQYLKVVWWARGVISALSLIGVLDQVFGLDRSLILAFTHSIAARWTELLQAAVGWIDLALPWHLDFSRSELNLLVIAFSVFIPFFFSVAWTGYSRSKQAGDTRFQIFSVAMTVIGSVLLFASLYNLAGPDDQLDLFRNSRAHQWYEWVALTFSLVVLLTMAFMALFLFAKPYAQAIVVVLTFVATFELLYFASQFIPVIQDWMKAVVDWINPS